MPQVTPNLDAQPWLLESPDPVAIIRQHAGLNVPFTNSTDKTLFAGEPVLLNGKACLIAATSLKDTESRAITEWIADVILDPSLAAAIDTGDNVYFDLDINAVGAGLGAATNVQPTNGFILGKAVRTPGDTRVNGYGMPVAASTSDQRVRVASTSIVATTYGTVPKYSE